MKDLLSFQQKLKQILWRLPQLYSPPPFNHKQAFAAFCSDGGLERKVHFWRGWILGAWHQSSSCPCLCPACLNLVAKLLFINFSCTRSDQPQPPSHLPLERHLYWPQQEVTIYSLTPFNALYDSHLCVLISVGLSCLCTWKLLHLHPSHAMLLPSQPLVAPECLVPPPISSLFCRH